MVSFWSHKLRSTDPKEGHNAVATVPHLGVVLREHPGPLFSGRWQILRAVCKISKSIFGRITLLKHVFMLLRLIIINQFISRHSTEARATVRLCRIKEKCLKTDLKCVNGWSSSTVQWKIVPKSRSSNREMTSSSVQVVWRNWQKLLCGWSQQVRLTVWADQISEVAWLLERSIVTR